MRSPGSLRFRSLALIQFAVGTLLALGLPGLMAQAQVPDVQLEEEVRVGSVWDDDRMLADVGGVAVFGDSLLLVLDRIELTIKVFDWEGDPVTRIGRYGSGPGEFKFPYRLRVRNDTIFVSNGGSGTLMLLNIDGDELTRLSFPRITVAGGTRIAKGPSGILPDGALLGIPGATRPYLMEDGKEYHPPILKVGSSGQILDTLCVWREIRGGSISTPGLQFPKFSLPAETPSDIYATSSSAGLVAVAEPVPPGHEAQYRITSIRHTGDTIFSRLYDFEPRRLDRQMGISLALENSRYAKESQRILEAMAEAYAARRYVPPVSGLRIDSAGRIWVAGEKVPGEPVQWQVLTPLGEPLFRIQIPAGVRLWYTSGDLIWLEERDELGVPFIVRYRIRDRD